MPQKTDSASIDMQFLYGVKPESQPSKFSIDIMALHTWAQDCHEVKEKSILQKIPYKLAQEHWVDSKSRAGTI
jgi:hypothetical protein